MSQASAHNPQLFNHHNKITQLCTLRPTRNQNQSFLKLGFNGSLQRRRKNSILRPKSVLSVEDKVLESGKVDRNGKNSVYDAIVIGSGIGGLVAATQLAVKGARVLVLEKYVIPGGSSGFYQRDGYTFDVGSSVMFGFSEKVSILPLSFCFSSYIAYLLRLAQSTALVHFHREVRFNPCQKQRLSITKQRFLRSKKVFDFIKM